MASVNEVYKAVDRWAPFETQMSFDNAGLLVGHLEHQVSGIMVALDVTPDVIEESASVGADLIVSHHPVIFDPVRRLTDDYPTGQVLLSLVEKGMAAICAHTNLDAAMGGVNDCLAEVLGLSEVRMLEQDGVDRENRPYGIGRYGKPHKDGLSPAEYAQHVKSSLLAASVRFVDAGRPVHRVAVGGGACGSMLAEVASCGCDTFVTADVKYNIFLEAQQMGINLMDAGHYATETVICPALYDYLSAAFPDTPVHLSKNHLEVYQEA